MKSNTISGVDPYRANPLVTLAALAAGWLAAINLVPTADYYLPGALTSAGIALAGGLLGGPIIYALYRPMTILRVDHILMGGIFFWIVFDSIQGSYGLERASYQAVLVVFNSIALFAFALTIGCAISPFRSSKLPDVSLAAPGVNYLFFAGLLCFSFGIIRILISCRLSVGCIYGAFFVPRFSAAWSVTDIGNFDTLLAQLKYGGYLILPLAVGIYDLQGKLTWQAIFLAILGLLFASTLIADGDRRLVGIVLLSAVLAWMMLHRPVRVRHLVIAAVGAIVILILMQAMLQWRDAGFGNSIREGRTVSFSQGLYIDRNLKYFSMIPDVVPEYHPHTGSDGIISILTAPVPRSVFPTKPVKKGFHLVQVLGLRKQSQDWIWMITAVGDFYLIGGYFAVAIGGLIFGVLANLVNGILYKPNHIKWVIIYALATMILFVALRAAQELTGFAAILLLIWGMWTVWRVLMEKERSMSSAGLQIGPGNTLGDTEKQ